MTNEERVLSRKLNRIARIIRDYKPRAGFFSLAWQETVQAKRNHLLNLILEIEDVIQGKKK